MGYAIDGYGLPHITILTNGSNVEIDNSGYTYTGYLEVDPEPTQEEPVDPNADSGSGEQEQGGQQGGSQEQGGDTPATGVELNIGIAVLSLALVSAMFVIVRRKEER